MMTPEMQAIVDVCRRFAVADLRQGALDADLASDSAWVRTVWRQSAELGLPALLLPEDLGGAAQDHLCAALVLDTLAAECAGVASIFLHHYAAIGALANDPAQTALLAPHLANSPGNKPCIAAVIFPAEDDATRLRLETDNGTLRLSGRTPLTANAALARTFLLFLPEDEAGTHVTCLLIDRETPGLTLSENAKLPGLKVNPFHALVFDRVVPTALITSRGEARALCNRALDLYHNLIAACAMGAARAAYQRALAYARDRYQYGRLIIEHQEIQRLLGSMHTKIAVGTTAYRNACMPEDDGLAQLRLDGRAAKIFCTDAALEIALDAVQVHGGYGYMHDYGVEKIMRDVKVLQLLGGSSPVLSIRGIREQIAALE